MAKKKDENGTAVAQAPPPSVNGNGNPPFKRFLYPVNGGSLSISCWEKSIETQLGPRTVFSFALQRSFHDGSDWQFTNYIRDVDLPVVAIAVQQAYLWIVDLKAQLASPVKDDLPE